MLLQQPNRKKEKTLTIKINAAFSYNILTSAPQHELHQKTYKTLSFHPVMSLKSKVRHFFYFYLFHNFIHYDEFLSLEILN